ncbi:MAG: hypothetical protein GQ525_08005 [Draconibacterium sp.]|nr:hypothetical protein [Draconibacterium sp.]
MKKIILILSVILLVVLNSCEPRITMDMDQWGDQAIITNVQVFKYEVDDNPNIYETMNDIGDISGLRRIIISNPASVDLDNSIVTISLKGEESLNEAGLIFYHQSERIEPVNGPIGGIVGDLSSRSLTYRLHSVNGTTREWAIIIE